MSETQTDGNVAPAEEQTAETANPQESAAGKATNEEAPEATQETAEQQEAPETEVKAEETAEEEKLYAGKYKSVEDMEKAYRELQSKSTKDSQEKAELSRILNEAFLTPEPQQAQQQSQDYQDDDYEEQESNPASQELEGIKRSQAVMNFVFSHPDADGNAINEVMKTDPMVKNINGHDAKLEYAYLKSQNMGSKKTIAEAEKKAAQKTQAKIAEKQTAQVEGSGQSQKVDRKTELKEKMSTGSLQDREAARREYIREFMV